MSNSNKYNDKSKKNNISDRKVSDATGKHEPSKIKLANKSILDVEITGLDDEGYGIAASETHPLRISGALPGDTVRAVIDHVAQRIAFGHVKKILTPSSSRSKRPPCNDSGHCLGCPLIAMKYRNQTEWKQQYIQKQLRQYRELDTITVHPLLSPTQLIHYRTTARLVIAGKHSEPYIGIFKRSSHDVFDLIECPIHHPIINRIVDTVRRAISKMKITVYNPRSKMGLLRYLVVRVSESEQKAMVVFVTSKRSYNEIHHLGRFLSEHIPEVEVMAQNVNSSEGNVIMGATDHFLTPKHQLTEKIGNVSLMISPRSFFQVNPYGASLIYDKIRDWAKLNGNETVLDLYCGIGSIALSLAPQVRKVIGFEIVDSAVADARKNARINGINNCIFEAGDAAELMKDLADDGEHIDVAVLNPPRKGCEIDVLRRVTAIAPSRLLYISCSPQSLARDLSILKKLGYGCQEIQPVDLFPQTMHVENICLLESIG